MPQLRIEVEFYFIFELKYFDQKYFDVKELIHG